MKRASSRHKKNTASPSARTQAKDKQDSTPQPASAPQDAYDHFACKLAEQSNVAASYTDADTLDTNAVGLTTAAHGFYIEPLSACDQDIVLGFNALDGDTTYNQVSTRIFQASTSLEPRLGIKYISNSNTGDDNPKEREAEPLTLADVPPTQISYPRTYEEIWEASSNPHQFPILHSLMGRERIMLALKRAATLSAGCCDAEVDDFDTVPSDFDSDDDSYPETKKEKNLKKRKWRTNQERRKRERVIMEDLRPAIYHGQANILKLAQFMNQCVDFLQVHCIRPQNQVTVIGQFCRGKARRFFERKMYMGVAPWDGTVEEFFKALTEHCIPRNHDIKQQRALFSCTLKDRTIRDFADELTELAATINFKEEDLRRIFLQGLPDDMKEKMLSGFFDPFECSFARLVDWAQNIESWWGTGRRH